ncbi:hypothetical protein ABG067_001184 [Albugo candida]|uniref:F-box/LRR-repeat protein 15-like leucin rich repeat domain-containing protein n=1 Tax=Albugo candida TaxID=65357 RepID=A0A024G1B3_9STRA|nr:unnamed protein product [Albugo candida]|eukprot:CCI40110.1 unnamed protein product [Albugo candida]
MRTRSTREHDATDARIEVQSSSETAENEEQSAIDNPRPIRVFGAGRQSVSWPGYMQTAQQLADNRLAAQLAREKELIDRNTSSTESNTWIPHRKKPRTAMHFQNTVLPSLRELAVQVLTQYIEQMPTLEYLDASARHRVAYQVAKMRKFDSIVLPLFVFPGVTEIDLPDCSSIDEASFLEALKCSSASKLTLTVLRLNFCGRCISDQVLMELGNAIQSVEILSLQGCYRLSDSGCETLVRQSAPSIKEFELSCNQRITKKSVEFMSELQHLYSLTLSECPQLTDDDLFPLCTMRALEQLKLEQMVKLSDNFVSTFLEKLPNLKQISLSRCSQLKDDSVRAIFTHCRGLQRLDLSDMPLISDDPFALVRELGHPLVYVDLQRCIHLSDLAFEHIAFGASKYLESVKMSSITGVTDATLQALQLYCSKNLTTLDVSFCRKITEDGLGNLTDHCEKLQELSLWGCTHITSSFLNGHKLDNLTITGHPLLTGLSVRH